MADTTGFFARLFGFGQDESVAGEARDDQRAARLSLAPYIPQAIGRQLVSNDASVASAPAAYREPILQMTARLPGFGAVHETQGLLWHAIRQFVPSVDSAILNRRVLEGRPEAEARDEGLQSALQHFMDTVAVGYLEGQAQQRGISHYLEGLAAFADEYGLAAGECVLSEDARQIARLVMPTPRSLTLRRDSASGYYALYQHQASGQRRIDDRPLVQVLSFRSPVDGPWPPPMVWAATKAVEGSMRVQEGGLNSWWIHSETPRLLGHAFDKDATPDTVSTTYPGADGLAQTVEVPASVLSLKTSLEAMLAAKRAGKVGNVLTYVQGGEMINDTLGPGSDAIVKFFREHQSVFDGMIVGLSQTPIWMYPWIEPGRGEGLGSQLSNAEAKIFSVAARDRQQKLEALLRQTLDLFLVLDGSARFVGAYDVRWSSASIVDAEAEAAARLAEAMAADQEVANLLQLYDDDGQRRFSGELERELEEAGHYRAA